MVLTGVALGVAALVLQLPPWIGALLLGGTVLGAAAYRLAVPDRRAGWLAARSRTTDVALLAVLGFLFMVSATWLVVMD